jgi:hypothetical protein
MALGVNIVSEFDSKGIRRALTEFKKLEGAGAKSTFALRTMDSAVSNGLKNVAKFGGIAAAGLGLVGFQMAKGAEFAKQADDRLMAVTKSMNLFGEANVVVAQRLQKLADVQEYELGVTAETIKMTQAKLLTFKNIGREADVVGGAFDRATTAAIDLAAAGFGAAEMNAVQLGKALQDPIKGITALARSGVTFTDAEKAKIKALVESNKMLEAQDTLLKAIETQVGGTAAATVTDTFKIAAAFGHIRDEIGTVLLPVIEKFADFMVKKVVPFATEAGRVFGEQGFGGGVKYLVGELHGFIQGGNKAVDIILGIGTALAILKGVTIAATIAQNLFNVALFSNPIGIAVAAIIALGIAVAAAYVRFEGFRKVVNFVINAVIGYFEFMTNMWIRAINLVIKGVNLFSGILNAVGINVPKLGEIGEVTFGRIGDAADKAKGKVVNVLKMIQTAEAKNLGEKAVRTTTGSGDDEGVGVGSGVAKTVKTAIEKLKEYTDVLKSASDAERSLAKTGKDGIAVRADLDKATQRVSEAQAKFNQVTRGYGADSKEAVDAMRRVQDAGKRLRDANLSQQDSVRSLANAEQKLADLRNLRADPENVAGAERKLERSKYSTEEAIFRVAEAEAELAAVRTNPESSAVDIRRAEIDLAEAKLSVTDSTIAQRDAEKDLEDLRNIAASAGEIAEAERELERAKYAVQDATDAVRDATVEQAIAQAFYTEIVDGAKEGSEAYTDALKDLRDAQEAERDASEKVTDQLWREFDATNALRDAKEKLAAVGMEVGGRIVGRATNQFNANRPSALNMPGGITPIGAAGGGGTSIVNNINAGMGADASQIAQVIVDSLRDYERSNGFIPVTAQYAIAI